MRLRGLKGYKLNIIVIVEINSTMNTPLVISRIADACDIPTLKSWISTCRHYHQTVEDYYKRISGVEECQGTWTRTVRGDLKNFVFYRYQLEGNREFSPIIITDVRTRGKALLKVFKHLQS